MYKYSDRSNEKLKHADKRFQRLFKQVIKYVDITIVCTHRSETEQNIAFRDKKSNAKWGESPHNCYPSKAVDVAMYIPEKKDVSWTDKDAAYVAGVVMTIANWMGIRIKWGGNFKSIDDLPHFELENWDEQ